MCKAFAKKLFGAKYERIKKNIMICMVLFLGLRTAELQIEIAPFVLYLMTGTFTAGIMWQALSSEDHTAGMQNMLMLPFEGWKLTTAYVSMLGTYTILTKTGLLLAVAFAVSPVSMTEAAGSVLCVLNAVVMSSCIYAHRKYRALGMVWSGLLIVFLFWGNQSMLCLPVLTANLMVSVYCLLRANPYSYYLKPVARVKVKEICRYSVWRYLFRYMVTHKNYLANTGIMWGVACLLPAFVGELEQSLVLPLGFAILSLNTPICILISCDPSLEQAIRFLPGQKKKFLVPYCLFIFLCNLVVDVIFIISWELQMGGITASIVLVAIIFALLGAVGSVCMEWFLPLRNWKIESDLWHHPRKYVVSLVLVLLAGIISM